VEAVSIENPWFAAVVTVLCVALAGVIQRLSPWYRARLNEQATNRQDAIDGLRGFLALAVLFTHVMTTHEYYVTGQWGGGSSASFFGVAGQAGVSLFFMITGFLFWSRALRGPIDTRALYRSRIRRLTPMYLVSAGLALLVIAALSGFRLHTDPVELARELRPWLSFGFLQTGDVNGVKDAHIVNAVYWTLAFEWSFYLALPFLALFARGRSFVLLAALVLYFGLRMPITLNFLAGALTAMAMQNRWLTGRLSSPWLSVVPLAALGGVLGMMDTAYSLRAVVLLFVFFVFVADGNSLFGLLRTRAAKMLGLVSYSYYLLHGMVVFVAYRLVDTWVSVADLDGVQHWTVAAIAALFTVVLSSVTYRRVEYPFLAPRPKSEPEPLARMRQASAP
jgi:peptidoglycan/LPS O-acetylase OafA/YrhL